MPLYDYACERCGSFTALRPMAAYQEPCACPTCGAEAPRVLLTAPAFLGMNEATRRAHAVNERSAHEPRRSQAHGPGCGGGCCRGPARSGAAVSPGGAKSFPGRRPWMISH
jgi:putative FmdB family regulatory protein